LFIDVAVDPEPGAEVGKLGATRMKQIIRALLGFRSWVAADLGFSTNEPWDAGSGKRDHNIRSIRQ
jgi:hypothetical protein